MNLLLKYSGAYTGSGPEGQGGLHPLGNNGSGHLIYRLFSDTANLFLSSSTPVFHIKLYMDGGPETNR